MGRIIATLAVVGALLYSAGSAWADFDDGVEAYNRGDYATALQEFRPLAEQGDAKAQFNLGFMYDNGQGVPQDDVEAAAWYHKAAEQGYADAQNTLGFMYADGEGVSPDVVEAVAWFRKAAEQGLSSAQFNLGLAHANGEGAPQDNVEAYKWLNLAATFADASTREEFVDVRDSVAGRLTPQQLDEGQKLAREWFASQQLE